MIIASMAFIIRLSSTCCTWMRSPKTAGTSGDKWVCIATSWACNSGPTSDMISLMVSLRCSESFCGADFLTRARMRLMISLARWPHLIDVLRGQPAKARAGVVDDGAERLIDFVGDGCRQLAQRRDPDDVRELQLDLSDSVFGPLPLDELSDLTPDRNHHVEEILVGLSDLAAEEVDDAQYFAAEQNGKGERRMQSFTRRDRRAGKRRTLLRTEVGKVDWLPAPPNCTRQTDPGLERGRARFGFKFRNLNGFFMPHLDATEYARLLVHRPKRSHVPYQVFTD